MSKTSGYLDYNRYILTAKGRAYLDGCLHDISCRAVLVASKWAWCEGCRAR